MLDEDEVSRVGRLGRDLWVAWENVREGWENPHLQRDGPIFILPSMMLLSLLKVLIYSIFQFPWYKYFHHG